MLFLQKYHILQNLQWKTYSVKEIYEAIELILKTGLQPIFKPDLPGEAFQNLADISKAESLSWKPQVSLEQGLRLSIDYIRDNVLNTMELTPS